MMLSRISESENENPIPGRTNNINIPDPEPDHQKLSNASNNRESQLYCPPLPFSSRNNNNNSSKYSHNFTGFKTEIENDHQGLFSDNHQVILKLKLLIWDLNLYFWIRKYCCFVKQGGEPRRNRSPMLSHHLSLPKISGEISFFISTRDVRYFFTRLSLMQRQPQSLSITLTSGEIVAMEKLLQFRDTTTVPCKIRAKRGCATHPRSIAERVHKIFYNFERKYQN